MLKSALEVFKEWVESEIAYGEVRVSVKVCESKIKEIELVQGGVIRRFREEVK